MRRYDGMVDGKEVVNRKKARTLEIVFHSVIVEKP
jgi:hypothetical protein